MIKFPGLKLGPDPSAQSRTLCILQKRHIVATEFHLLNVSKYMQTIESHSFQVLGLGVLHLYAQESKQDITILSKLSDRNEKGGQ